MSPRHHQIARQVSQSILASLETSEPNPGRVVLAKYESQLDYETLRPEDQPATVEDHAEMIEWIATALATHLYMRGIELATPVINASQYLRWLAAEGLTNNAANRAAFVANPPFLRKFS